MKYLQHSLAILALFSFALARAKALPFLMHFQSHLLLVGIPIKELLEKIKGNLFKTNIFSLNCIKHPLCLLILFNCRKSDECCMRGNRILSLWPLSQQCIFLTCSLQCSCSMYTPSSLMNICRRRRRGGHQQYGRGCRQNRRGCR